MTYCTPIEERKARKQHRCHWCGEPIIIGETYLRWTNYDGIAIANKFHPECHSQASEDGEFEYIRYNNERPIKQEAPINATFEVRRK